VVAIEMPPPWAAACESQAMTAHTKPVMAAMMAVLGPSVCTLSLNMLEHLPRLKVSNISTHVQDQLVHITVL